MKDMQILIGYAWLILLHCEDKVRHKGQEGNAVLHLIQRYFSPKPPSPAFSLSHRHMTSGSAVVAAAPACPLGTNRQTGY